MLLLPREDRERLWRRLAEIAERYIENVARGRVAPELSPEKLRELLAPFDFESPRDPLSMADFAADALSRFQTHTPHPRYYGLINPAPATMGVAADFLVAAFNPQMAAWSHSPFAAEVENHLCRAFGARFGYDPATADGVFCSGGMEANHTAVLTALTASFPEYGYGGTRAVRGQPVLYVSREAHHSFLKAARLCGLGTDAVREVPVDTRWRMDVDELQVEIARDLSAGMAPFLVVATAGTTNEGAVDPIAEIGAVAASAGAWFHVDAAWGGAAVFARKLKPLLEGIEKSDSITFDAHKWLSVPMGAGLYLTRRPDILTRTFRVDTAYMPRDAAGLPVVDPHQHSIQWSRRFIGLKVFLSLAVAGWEGYAAAVRHMTEMGDRLREGLTESGWRMVNDTPLPLVCFVDATREGGGERSYLEAIARGIVSSGKAWISTTMLAGSLPCLRACITNYRTGPEDVDALVRDLNDVRASSPL